MTAILPATPYQVALFTRGAGAYAYTYTGSDSLAPGQVVAVVFRARIELGVVLGVDSAPPSGVLLPLWPLTLSGAIEWGSLLLELSELSTAAPDEIAGHVLFSAPTAGIKLNLSIKLPYKLDALMLATLGSLAGALTPGKRALLGQSATWHAAVAAASDGAVELEAVIAGTGLHARSHPRWRKWYAVDRSTLKLWSIPEPQPEALPGSYLAGLAQAADFSAWPAVRQPQLEAIAAAAHPSRESSSLNWEPLTWPEDWDMCRRWPGVREIPVRRAAATWAALRAPGGLPAELAGGIAAGENLLLIAPQAWMLDRLWPLLAPWARRVMRFLPDGGASAAGHILRQLHAAPGQVVAGGPGAWKLAAYGRFDRVLLLDPSHPQYAFERYPSLDPRQALLLAMAAGQAGAGGALPRLDLIELGLSAWDGRGGMQQVHLLDAFEPPPQQPRPGGQADTNPLPLALRQPGRRRLVYFNRLGSSRGLRCVECQQAVVCPNCRSARIHYSAAQRGYRCAQCGYTSRELRCPGCGMAALAAQLPGLEAVTLRPGDLLVQGAEASRQLHAACETVLGTSQLLEPLAGFWPQDIVYVHADAHVAHFDDWPQALDMAARLSALYANPGLEQTYLISDNLQGQLGPVLSAVALMEQWRMEYSLRRLAGLPPYGCIYRLHVLADSRKAVAQAREQLGRALQPLPGTRLLRLGRPYEERGQFHLAGFLINPELSSRQLHELRWQVYRGGARLNCTTLRGPWL